MSDGAPKPSIGRIVHYHSYGTPGGEFKPEPRAAIVAAVSDTEDQKVTVVVFNPTGLFFNEVPFSEDGKPGTWSWPPRA